MKLVDLLAGSKTHTLDFFPPIVVANVEKRLADKDGKSVIRCLVRDKLIAAKPEDRAKRAVEIAIEQDEKAALESLKE